MNFHTALQSPVVQIYLAFLGGVVVVAGIVLSIYTWVLKKDVKSVWTTYKSWLVIAPLVIGAIIAGRVPIIVLLTTLSILGFKEFARATGLYRDWWMTGAVYVAIIALGITILMPDPFRKTPGWFGMFMSMPVFAISFFVLIPIIRDRTQGQLQAMALAITGFIYIGWCFLHLAFLADLPCAYGYLLYLLVAVELNDVAAFTCGRILGKPGRHAFRPHISPKKTWEGALGAMCVSMALPWIMRFSFPQFHRTELLLTGLIVGIGGQLGDLSISVIKRDVGIKDMGALIPGHGGVLDRIDSLIYTSALFLHMVDYYGHW